MANELTITRMVHDQGFIKQAQDVLGEGTQQFLSSVLTLANSDSKLKELDPVKLYNCCLMAAAIKLPFNQNLGQAYIIAYKGEPQLQIGWKGFVQLAQRSGQFKTIGARIVYENEISGINPMTGEIMFDFKFERERTGKIVGYMSYFLLLNGFEKNLYMTVEELQRHGKRYSQTFKANKGVWVDNFDAMAQKTVIKLLLSKYAPLSIDLQKAIELDQADADGDYTDNKPRVELVEATLGESEEDRKEAKAEVHDGND